MTHLKKGVTRRTLGEKPETAGSDDVSRDEGRGDDELCR